MPRVPRTRYPLPLRTHASLCTILDTICEASEVVALRFHADGLEVLMNTSGDKPMCSARVSFHKSSLHSSYKMARKEITIAAITRDILSVLREDPGENGITCLEPCGEKLYVKHYGHVSDVPQGDALRSTEIKAYTGETFVPTEFQPSPKWCEVHVKPGEMSRQILDICTGQGLMVVGMNGDGNVFRFGTRFQLGQIDHEWHEGDHNDKEDAEDDEDPPSCVIVRSPSDGKDVENLYITKYSKVVANMCGSCSSLALYFARNSDLYIKCALKIENDRPLIQSNTIDYLVRITSVDYGEFDHAC